MKITDRNQFGDLLNEMGRVGDAVVVGVRHADFAREFMDRWKGKRLLLLDTREFATEQETDALCASMYPHISRCSIRSVPPGQVGDCWLDFVYIDSSPDDKSVNGDLALWYPQLMRGGVFAGSDFLMALTYPGVQRAVCAFAAQHDIAHIEITYEPGGSWWWIKP